MILLENLLTTNKRKYRRIGENLNANYMYLSNIDETNVDVAIANLKKQKYKCTQIAKNFRNRSIYTGAVAVVVSVILTLGTSGIALTNSIYADTKDRVNKVTSEQIQNSEKKLKELQDEYNKAADDDDLKETDKGAIEELKQTEKNQTKTAKNIDKEIFDYGADLKLQGFGFLGWLIVLAIIFLGSFYSLVSWHNDKASYYETLCVMIEDKINEIKAKNWSKAQKVNLKIEDGIKIKDNVIIRY